jgi:hypothetical protein
MSSSSPQETAGGPARAYLSAGEVWTCPYCKQSIEIISGRPELPPGYFQKCLLRDRMIADECIAYRNLDRARELIAERRPAPRAVSFSSRHFR